VSGLVTTGMDVFGQVWNQPHRPTQPPTFRGMGNECRPKCVDALWLGNKNRYDIFPSVDKCVGGR